MTGNYARIVEHNIQTLFAMDPNERASALPARYAAGRLEFKAFGKKCLLDRNGIILNDDLQQGPLGIIISLYALHASTETLVAEPFKSFKELPGSMPYAGAFSNRSEQCLVPIADCLPAARQTIIDSLDGFDAPAGVGGDFSMAVRPLPKIALCYIAYSADEDFPATVTCLFSHNAERFLPTDILADLGEYTSKAVKELTK